MTVDEMLAELQKAPSNWTVKIADWNEDYAPATEDFKIKISPPDDVGCVVLG